MKAAYYAGNRTITIEPCRPEPPARGQVRINVSHCGICGTDLHIFHGKMDGRVRVPQVVGHEMSGTVAEVGEGVNGWNAGDRVVVRPLGPCGTCPACRAGHSHICHSLKFMGIDTPGAFQGSWTVPAHTLHHLPDTVSLKHGALVEPIAVACHDVRLGEVKPDEYAVVIGGGPIGMLVALVARTKGARVLVSEINPSRVRIGRGMGLAVVDPRETDLPGYVNEQTGGAGADVVFEVSASAAGAEVMTQLPRTRGRIVVVGIFSEPPQVDLFRFFWRELGLRGARVYEPEDFEEAISLLASGRLPVDALISAVAPLDSLQQTFESMEAKPDVMKVLIDCSV